MFGTWQGGIFEDYSTAPQTAPSAQPEEQGMVRWELPSLADTQGSHRAIASMTCTQACGDVLRIGTKTQLESDSPWSCSCSSLCHFTGCCQCRFFFGNFEQGRKFSLNSSWASLSLCRVSKGSFYCIRQLDSSIHRHNLLKVLKLVFFFLIRAITTHSSSLSSLFPTGKGSAEEKTPIKSVKIFF